MIATVTRFIFHEREEELLVRGRPGMNFQSGISVRRFSHARRIDKHLVR